MLVSVPHSCVVVFGSAPPSISDKVCVMFPFRLGDALHKSAATPLTCGDAIDVPCKVAYALGG